METDDEGEEKEECDFKEGDDAEEEEKRRRRGGEEEEGRKGGGEDGGFSGFLERPAATARACGDRRASERVAVPRRPSLACAAAESNYTRALV